MRRWFAVAVTNELLARLKLAAVVERHTIKGFLLAPAEEAYSGGEVEGAAAEGEVIRSALRDPLYSEKKRRNNRLRKACCCS